ncbi:hypothetical protein C8J56DRAFT_899984 [Mycena floridula]|nr:hypothetical protein C8J56DRAFT_899984 [Mycena floridula]
MPLGEPEHAQSSKAARMKEACCETSKIIYKQTIAKGYKGYRGAKWELRVQADISAERMLDDNMMHQKLHNAFLFSLLVPHVFNNIITSDFQRKQSSMSVETSGQVRDGEMKMVILVA